VSSKNPRDWGSVLCGFGCIVNHVSSEKHKTMAIFKNFLKKSFIEAVF